MSDHVDLDLVELRCKLRGWTFFRRGNCVDVQCKYGGLVSISTSEPPYRECGWDTPAHKRIEALLTAPRWTLKRLLSEPPEGWKVLRRPDYRYDHWEAAWVWGRCLKAAGVIHDVYEVKFRLLSNGNMVSDVWAASDGVRLAERHSAASEFALILEEVKP